MSTVKKNYDFFAIFKHTKVDGKKGFDDDHNNYDLTKIDDSLHDRFLSEPKNVSILKLNSSSYAGITHIRCIDNNGETISRDDKFNFEDPHLWIFNIEKANITNKAVIVQVTKDIGSGRKEYGDNPDEGAAIDTAVCFNPFNGVVVIPPRSGMGISSVLTFFHKISLEQGLVETIVRGSTEVGNLDGLSKVNEISIRVSEIADNSQTKEAGIAIYNKLKSKKFALRLYGGDMDLTGVKGFIKKIKSLSKGDANVEKIQIDGEYNENHQLIDLVDHRMIATDEIQVVNKITIDQMMSSVYKAYTDNKMKLDISHTIKNGSGV